MILDLYRDSRLDLLELGRTLSEDQAATLSPACPAWTVKDLYAHQAGVAADVLAGRLDGVATAPWADRQVAERADWTLGEVLDEWERNGPELEDRLADVGDAVDPRLVLDVWTHGQDVRGALDRPARRDGPVAQWCTQSMVARFGSRLREAGLAPLTLDVGHEELIAGGDRAADTLAVSRFELLRAATGRRSRSQILAWAWPSEPSAYVDALTVFPPRATPLDEG